MPFWLMLRAAQPYLILLLHIIELVAMIQRLGGIHKVGRVAQRYARRWSYRK